jgi:hypothetical protein
LPTVQPPRTFHLQLRSSTWAIGSDPAPDLHHRWIQAATPESSLPQASQDFVPSGFVLDAFASVELTLGGMSHAHLGNGSPAYLSPPVSSG